jgi:outer membrane protein TolC
MIKRTACFSAFALFLVISGCAASQPVMLTDNSIYLAEPVPAPQKQKLQVPDGPISLQEAVELALANSAQVRMADIGVAMGRDNLLLAKSSYLPKLSVQATYHRVDVVPKTVIPGVGSFSFQPRELTNTSTSLFVPIYTFGKNAAAYREALRSAEAAEFDAARARQNIIAGASEAYFRLLEAKEFLTVAQKSVEQIRAHLRVAEQFYKQGMVTKNDVLAAKVRLLSMEHEQLRAESNIKIGTANLNRVIGLPISNRTILSDQFSPVELDLTEEDCLHVAMSYRPELGSMDRQRKAAQAAIKSAKAQRFPSINLGTSWNWTSNDTVAKKHEWTVDLIGEWTPFAGMATTAAIRLARRGLELLDQGLRELIDGIALEVKTAYLNVLQSRKRIDVATEGVKQAKENLRVFRENYAQGLVPSTEVLDAEAQLARARADLAQALYENNAAVVSLQNAMARTVEDVSKMRSSDIETTPAVAEPDKTKPEEGK